jgi:phenylalanyl-tRNA synthetase beta chain
VKIVHQWLSEMVAVPADVGRVAEEISLRGFEVASVEHGVIDFEITANRPDCLSHAGVAREAAVIWNTAVKPPAMGVAIADAPAFPVSMTAPDLCPRYCAQVFDVRVAPSPAWLAERLEAAGVRPINNVVDVTNYVMLELGQPMHAFDVERLGGRQLVIRRASEGERIRTLDGVARELDPEMLIIADADRPAAIGGVMGGYDSEISDTTTRMVLESAYFHPPSIRRTSKRLGLKTEASTRFERGGDVEAPPLGLRRAAHLFQQIGAATAAGRIVDVYPAPRPPATIVLRAARIARVLGQAVPSDEVPRILVPLGFTVTARDDGNWTIGIPSFRVDVTREVDLIEEVGRHHGFDRLPITFPALAAPQAPPDRRIAQDRLARQVLTAAGFSEAMTFAFIERQAALPFCADGAEPAAIANPLSEKFAVLRPSLLPGLVDSCAHNRRRGRKEVRLFETGNRFLPSTPRATQGHPEQGRGATRTIGAGSAQAREGRAAAAIWHGAADGPHWSGATRAVDFFDAKGVAERLCAAFGVADPQFVPLDRRFLVRGRAAAVRAGEVELGLVGQLAPAVAEARGLPGAEETYVAEIDLDALAGIAAADDLRARPLPRFPSIVRDVSILVDEALPAAAVRGTIRSAAPASLESIVEFDRYHGAGVPDGRVSLSLRLTFRAPDRTLTDEEAQASTERIVQALGQAHGAERR